MMPNILFASELNIAFASINPPRKITADIKEQNVDGLVKKQYTNIKVKNFNINSKHKDSIIDALDEISEFLYDALTNAGPALSTKEKQKANFPDLIYKGSALIPENIEALYAFHRDRKEYGVRFLTKLAQEQRVNVIIYEKIANDRKWKRFGSRIYKEDNIEKAGRGKLKPAIAVFNNFSQAQTYSYPTIQAKHIVEEQYETIQAIIENKAIDALKKAFNIGVGTVSQRPSNSDTNTEDSQGNEKKVEKQESTQNFSKDQTGGF